MKCNYKGHTLRFDWKAEPIKVNNKTKAEQEGFRAQLSTAVPIWMEQIVESYIEDQEIKELITAASMKQTGPLEYYLHEGLLQFISK